MVISMRCTRLRAPGIQPDRHRARPLRLDGRGRLQLDRRDLPPS